MNNKFFVFNHKTMLSQSTPTIFVGVVAPNYHRHRVFRLNQVIKLQSWKLNRWQKTSWLTYLSCVIKINKGIAGRSIGTLLLAQVLIFQFNDMGL